MKVNTFSHKGKREVNQDFVLIQSINSDCYLYLVADGMGGYELGEKASKAVAENIFTFLSSLKEVFGKDIQKAINKANLSIRQLAEDTGKKLGATVGGIFLNKEVATCFWVGDVKIFHFRKDKLVFESTPHSLMNEVIKNQSIIEKEKAIKFKHVVTRSIQGEVENSQAEILELGSIKSEDVFFICSDGVHDILEGIQLQLILNSSSSTEEAISNIERRCNIDSKDNFSLISIQGPF